MNINNREFRDVIEFRITTVILPNGAKEKAVEYLINNTDLLTHIREIMINSKKIFVETYGCLLGAG